MTRVSPRGMQRGGLEDRCELYLADVERLRAAAGEPPAAEALGVWQRQRMSRIAQLEALNRTLERQLADLEDERRRAREEERLHARFQGTYGSVPYLARCACLCAGLCFVSRSTRNKRLCVARVWRVPADIRVRSLQDHSGARPGARAGGAT